MDLEDLTPAGGGSLSRPVLGPHGRPVVTFTAPPALHPDELWTPLSRTNDMTSGGVQGAPFGRPGYALEHEPLDTAEKQSGQLVQKAFSLHDTGGQIRSALRPGF
jgi:hypothetical protein